MLQCTVSREHVWWLLTERQSKAVHELSTTHEGISLGSRRHVSHASSSNKSQYLANVSLAHECKEGQVRDADPLDPRQELLQSSHAIVSRLSASGATDAQLVEEDGDEQHVGQGVAAGQAPTGEEGPRDEGMEDQVLSLLPFMRTWGQARMTSDRHTLTLMAGDVGRASSSRVYCSTKRFQRRAVMMSCRAKHATSMCSSLLLQTLAQLRLTVCPPEPVSLPGLTCRGR